MRDIERFVLSGGFGDDSFTGCAFGDTLLGQAGDDVLAGAGGGDLLVGGDGQDLTDGGDGDDSFEGGAGSDTLIGGEGVDGVFYRDSGSFVSVQVSLAKGEAAKTDALGEVAFDKLVGIENATGGFGDDLLIGDDGVNRLAGGWGTDTLTGGGGADRFAFALADSSVAAPDTITDFSRKQHDRIDVSAIDALPKSPEDDPLSFIGTLAFSGAGGELRYSTLAGSKLVEIDIDGDTAADFALDVQGFVGPFSFMDFVL